MGHHPIPAEYCGSCGDCLHCYAEDECLRSSDGKHQAPEAPETSTDGSAHQEGIADHSSPEDCQR